MDQNKRYDDKIINREKSKNIWKFFLLIFIFNVILLNWNDISWIFNHRVAPKGIQTLLQSQSQEKEEPVEYFERENSIDIAAINITAPIVLSQGISDRDFEIALNKGVTHFPGSALPGEDGVLILLGHSAPLGWPKINYDWVFSNLEKLNVGDQIDIYFNQRLFVYTITEKVFLEVGEDISSSSLNEPEIMLLSCWPPGKNIKRIGIRGVLTK